MFPDALIVSVMDERSVKSRYRLALSRLKTNIDDKYRYAAAEPKRVDLISKANGRSEGLGRAKESDSSTFQDGLKTRIYPTLESTRFFQ